MKRQNLYSIISYFVYVFALAFPFEKSDASTQCINLFANSESNKTSNKQVTEKNNDYQNDQEITDLSLSEDISHQVSRNGFTLKEKIFGIYKYEEVKIISFFSSDRNIEIQLYHRRDSFIDPVHIQKTGQLLLNTFQKILQQYAIVGVTFPAQMPKTKFNPLGTNPDLKIFTKGQKRWRLSIDLESTKPMNANVFNKKISAQSFTYENLTKDNLDIAEWMLRHEMGHTKVDQIIGRGANYFPHFKAINEGIADFYSWFGSPDRNFTSDLIDSRRSANTNYDEALKFIENRDVHRAGRFVTRQIIAFYEQSKAQGLSDGKFIQNFESYLEFIKPLIVEYGPYFHLWHFSEGMAQFFQNRVGLDPSKLQNIVQNFKIMPPTQLSLYSMQLNRKSHLQFPEISRDSLVLDTGGRFSKPGAAFNFPSHGWLTGDIFEHAYRKFWLSESGDLYLINVEITNKTSSSYLVHFGLSKIQTAEDILANSTSINHQQPQTLVADVAIYANEQSLHYSVLKTPDQAETVIKDFTQNYIVWLLSGVGGAPN